MVERLELEVNDIIGADNARKRRSPALQGSPKLEYSANRHNSATYSATNLPGFLALLSNLNLYMTSNGLMALEHNDSEEPPSSPLVSLVLGDSEVDCVEDNSTVWYCGINEDSLQKRQSRISPLKEH